MKSPLKALTVSVILLLAGLVLGDDRMEAHELPLFHFEKTLIEPSEMRYNPTGKLIFRRLFGRLIILRILLERITCIMVPTMLQGDCACVCGFGNWALDGIRFEPGDLKKLAAPLQCFTCGLCSSDLE